jgi:hypothetical protein
MMNPDDDKFEEMLKGVDRLAGKIKRIYKTTGKIQGKARCPVCENIVNWKIVEYNKHTMGACQTADCIRWRE